MSLSPPPPESSPRRGSWLSLLLVVILLPIVLALLYFLTLGAFGPVILIGGFVFALTGFHYFVWGRLLNRVLKDEMLRAEEETNRR